MKNYYEELEVSRHASSEVINKAYKTLAKKYHPDSTKENKELAEERFKKISEAYETLSDSEKKKKYDEQLNITEPIIDINKYNQLVKDNQVLSSEISKLKNNYNTNYNHSSAQNNNTYFTPQYTNSTVNNIKNTPQNTNRTTSQNRTYYEPSIIDIIKYKIDHWVKNLIAFVLTIFIIFILLCILLYVPFTRDFLLRSFTF